MLTVLEAADVLKDLDVVGIIDPLAGSGSQPRHGLQGQGYVA